MDELVDILDSDGRPTGKTCLKSVAHLNGYFHPTVHLWFYTSQGELLFQKRADTKETFPSLWDVSVAGHIASGENPEMAALREVQEEIGLTINPEELVKIGYFKSSHQHSDLLIDNEYHNVFLCQLNQSVSTLVKQDSEVDDLKLVSISNFQSKVNAKGLPDFVPHGSQYYQFVIEEILKRLAF